MKKALINQFKDGLSDETYKKVIYQVSQTS